MITALIVLDFILSFILIGLVLIQHGKGADMGSGFGAGAAGGVVESVSPANFLNKLTAVVAALFFIISLSLTALYQKQIGANEVIDIETLNLPEDTRQQELLAPELESDNGLQLEPQTN